MTEITAMDYRAEKRIFLACGYLSLDRYEQPTRKNRRPDHWLGALSPQRIRSDKWKNYTLLKERDLSYDITCIINYACSQRNDVTVLFLTRTLPAVI